MSEREEHDVFEDKKRRFVSCYEAHWKFLGRGDSTEAAEWWKLLAEVRLGDIDRIVEAVAKEWPKDKSPRRSLFRQAIRQLRAMRAEDLPPLEDCALCDNSGRMWCLGRKTVDQHGNEELLLSVDPNEGPLFKWVTTCTCLRGRRYDEGDRKLQQRILDWRENDFLQALHLSGRDYGLGTVGKLFAEDLIHTSYQGLRDEWAEKGRQKARVRFLPKAGSGDQPEEKPRQIEAGGHLEAIVERKPSGTVSGGDDYDEVPF